MDSFTVHRAVEKPALSEVEWDPRISFFAIAFLICYPRAAQFWSTPNQAETFFRSQGCSTFTEAIPAAVAA